MTEPTFIRLDSVKSTNSYLAEIAATSPHGLVVATREQTVGRGQRGNSWEAEPGKNLTFSILLRPDQLIARQQFAVSEAVAVAIARVLQQYITDRPVEVKWANDIYVGNQKICGILIENSLMGNRIAYSIAGIGINVNQQIFTSDAPNPVSLFQLIGQETDLDTLLIQITAEIISTVDNLCRPSMIHHIHASFLSMLWRRHGVHPYRDAASGATFQARIADVAPDGILHLVDTIGSHHFYAFKEVVQLI